MITTEFASFLLDLIQEDVPVRAAIRIAQERSATELACNWDDLSITWSFTGKRTSLHVNAPTGYVGIFRTVEPITGFSFSGNRETDVSRLRRLVEALENWEISGRQEINLLN